MEVIQPIQPIQPLIKSITKPAHPSFSHFFIVATRASNLRSCEMTALSLKIRIHPSVPIIQTNSAFCVENDVDFNSGFSLDFRSLPSYSISDAIPVIELHSMIGKNKQFPIGFCILPLRVEKILEIEGKHLTFLYESKNCEFQNESGINCGSLLVTIALGFAEHEKFVNPKTSVIPSQMNVHVIDEHSSLHLNDDVDTKTDGPLSAFSGKIPQKVQSTKTSQKAAQEEEKYHRYKSKHHRHRHKKKKSNTNALLLQALSMGFIPPQQQKKVDWKKKAQKHGYFDPSGVKVSSIAVNTDQMKTVLKTVIVQTDQLVTEKVEDDDGLSDLINILNEHHSNQSKSPHSSQISRSSTVSNEVVFHSLRHKKFVLYPTFEIFTKSPIIDSDNYEVSESILEIINQPEHPVLKSFPMSDDDDESQFDKFISSMENEFTMSSSSDPTEFKNEKTHVDNFDDSSDFSMSMSSETQNLLNILHNDF